MSFRTNRNIIYNDYDLNSNERRRRRNCNASAFINAIHNMIVVLFRLHHYKNQFTDIFWANLDPNERFIWLVKQFGFYDILSKCDPFVSLVVLYSKQNRNDFVEIRNLSDHFFSLYCCFDFGIYGFATMKEGKTHRTEL